jgi:glycerophosphoryl diester phosphodiesterase
MRLYQFIFLGSAICALSANQEMPTQLNTTTPLSPHKNIMVIAHRGASGYVPENTASSFAKAIELKVEAVEFDVYRCKSGELIVMHDADVARTTDGKGLIKDKTLQELKGLTIKGGGKIPTFSEVLDILNAQTKVVIDIKSEGIALALAQEIQERVDTQGWQQEQFYATGFQHEELKQLADLLPFVKLIPAAVCVPYKFAQFAEEMHAYGVCLLNAKNYFSESMARDIQIRGLKLWVWAEDQSLDAIKKLYDLGVDALMIDYPDKAKELLIQLKSKTR